MKIILSDKIENYENTSALNSIRFTVFNEGLNEKHIESLFENVLNEKILKICDEKEYEWHGYKYLLSELIEPFKLLDNNKKVHNWVSKELIEYFINIWGDKYNGYSSYKILKIFMNS